MDDWQRRKIFEKAYALIDPDRREQDAWEHRQWRARHFDPILQRVDLGEDEEIEPTPPSPQTSFQLTHAQILRLVDERVAQSSITPQVNEALDVVAKALDKLCTKIIELEKQNTTLRDDVEFLRVAKGNRVEMVTRGNRDVA